jgi:hypothetical protein
MNVLMYFCLVAFMPSVTHEVSCGLCVNIFLDLYLHLNKGKFENKSLDIYVHVLKGER